MYRWRGLGENYIPDIKQNIKNMYELRCVGVSQVRGNRILTRGEHKHRHKTQGITDLVRRLFFKTKHIMYRCVKRGGEGLG